MPWYESSKRREGGSVMWMKCNFYWCIQRDFRGSPQVPVTTRREAMGRGWDGIWVQRKKKLRTFLRDIHNPSNAHSFHSVCARICLVLLHIHGYVFHQARTMLVCSSMCNSFQILPLLEEKNPRPFLPALVCHKAPPVTRYVFKLCYTWLDTRKGFRLAMGNLEQQVIKSRARALSKLIHRHK